MSSMYSQGYSLSLDGKMSSVASWHSQFDVQEAAESTWQDTAIVDTPIASICVQNWGKGEQGPRREVGFLGRGN